MMNNAKTRSPLSGSRAPLTKEERMALNKEQHGFAAQAKAQEFRGTAQGENKALQDKVRELTDMLEDRKNANRLLNTENLRLKKLVGDLQVQLLNKPTARGESAGMKSMRDLAKQFQAQEAMTHAAAQQAVQELIAQNQAVVDELQRVMDERDEVASRLHATEGALAAAEAQLAAQQQEAAQLMDDKEALVRRGDELEQTIEQLTADVAALKQQLLEGDAAGAAARAEAEAALRSQRAALEAEAQLRKQAATTDMAAQVVSLKQQLQDAHDTIRSLNQSENLGPGWTLVEHGLPPGSRPAPAPAPAPAAAGAATAGAAAGSAAPHAADRSAPHAARARHLEDDAASVRSAAGGAAGEPTPPSAAPSARPSRRPSRTGSAAASVAGDPAPEPSPPPLPPGPPPPGALIPDPRFDPSGQHDGDELAGAGRGSAAGTRPVSRAGSVAASVGRAAAGPGEAGGPGRGSATGEDVVEEQERAGAAAGPSRPGSVAGSVAGSVQRGGGRASVAGSVAGGDGEVAGVADRALAPHHLEHEAEQVRSGLPTPARSRAPSVAGSVRSVAAGGARQAHKDGPGGEAAARSVPPVTAAAAAAAGEAPPAPVPPAPAGNVLELLLHDASLRPGVVGLPGPDFWPALRLVCPALPPLALINAALGGPGATSLELRAAHRLHFESDQHLLAGVAGAAVQVQLLNLKPAVVGAFSCPRVKQPPGQEGGAEGGAGGAGSAGTGVASAGVADGTTERVLVVACTDEYGCPSLELYCMDAEGNPTRHFQRLSAPWRPQLPDATQPPAAHEFCIDTHSLHRLQADAARASGLFDTAARVFVGRASGSTYQVWRLLDADLRRKATFKAINRVIVHPAEDPWAAAAPLATATLPLTAALTAPSLARLELANVRQLIANKPVVRLYEPSDDIATRSLSCRTASEKLVAVVRVTVRLAREPQVGEQLLGALQPALQSGSGTPALPPLHWMALLGAEEVQLGRLLGELRAAVATGCGRVMSAPPRDAASEGELRAAVAQMADAIRTKERQVAEGLAACRAVVGSACATSPTDAVLARERLAAIQAAAARSLAGTVVFLRQRVELYRLGAAAWHFIAHTCAGPEDPVAQLPTTTTPQQAQALAAALHDLAAALTALAPPGAAASPVALLTAGGGGVAVPLPAPAALPQAAAGDEAPANAAAAAVAAAAPHPVSEAARELEAALRAAVDAAAAAASDEGERVRRAVAAPGADDVALTEEGQLRVASIAAPVTAALVQGLACVCGAAVVSGLREADGCAALRDQLLAAAAGGGALGGVVGTAPGAGQLGQLLQQLAAAAGAKVVAAGAPGTAPRTTSAELGAALQSVQYLLGVLTRAAPPAVAPAPHAAPAWLKASTRLRVALSVAATAWSVGAVAAAGHALLLGGQRHAAAVLALEVLGRELDRVIDATKAALDAIRTNRAHDDALLSACMPAVATALTSHAATAITACFWTACQLVVTPLAVCAAGQQRPPAGAAAAAAAAAPGADAPAAAAGAAGSGDAGGVSGTGLTYSASLHATTAATYTLLTLGTVGGAGPGGAPGAAAPTRAEDPALAPLAHPMLSTWQPHGSVLYLDLPRLNALAAAAAAGGALPDGVPPVETPALPLLPAAAELLGWGLRHADEYYQAHYAAAATMAAAPAGGAGGGLAADPSVTLSEAKLAARMAAEVDVVVLAGARVTEAGSMVKWLAAAGALVVAAAELQVPAAMAAAGGDAAELARTLAGLLAHHQVQSAVARALSAGAGGGGSGLGDAAGGAGSGTATPRAPGSRRGSFSGASALAAVSAPDGAGGLPPGRPAAAPLQPLAVLTYLSDVSIAKPVLAAAAELTHRAGLSLQSLQASFASSPQLQPHTDMLARHCARLLAQHALLLEGVLLAPELLRARHPGTAPLPGSAVTAAVAALQAAGAAGGGDGALAALGLGGGAGYARGAAPPGLSRQGSVGRLRPVLPGMPPKGASRTSQAGQVPPVAAAPGMMAAARGAPGPYGAAAAGGAAAVADGGYSTASEDEEAGVGPLGGGRRGNGYGYGGGGAPRVALPDEPDAESDVASIVSASTTRTAASRRP